MSFQDVQLTPLIINELYRDFLVDIEDAHAPLPKWTSKVYAAETIETVIAPVNIAVPETGPILPKATEKKNTPDTEPAFSPTKKANTETNPVLLEVPVSKPVSDISSSASNARIKYLGGNKKRIAFIVNSSTDLYLRDTQRDCLQKNAGSLPA